MTCAQFRLWNDFDPWKIDGCTCAESVVRHKRSRLMKVRRCEDQLSTKINEWIKANRILNPEGEFVLLTTVRDRYLGRDGWKYVENENYYETTISLDFNKTLPWLWKARMNLLRAKERILGSR